VAPASDIALVSSDDAKLLALLAWFTVDLREQIVDGAQSLVDVVGR